MPRARWVFGVGIVVAVAAIPTCFHFSYEETADPVVTLRNGSLRPFEIEMKLTVEVSGNMHGPSLPFGSRETYEKSTWFYVAKDTGVVTASDLVFTPWRACPEPLWWQKNMRGSIEFLGSDLIVQIDMPRYEGSSSTPTEYVAWEHNGRYRIERNLESAVPLDRGGCGI
jgi:hypothetical protein